MENTHVFIDQYEPVLRIPSNESFKTKNIFSAATLLNLVCIVAISFALTTSTQVSLHPISDTSNSLTKANTDNINIKKTSSNHPVMALEDLQADLVGHKQSSLKYNFWINTFNHLSVNETIFHDKDHFNFIYKKINHEGLNYTLRTKKIKEVSDSLVKSFNTLANHLELVSLQKNEIFKSVTIQKLHLTQDILENITTLLSVLPKDYLTKPKLLKLALQIRYQQGIKEKFEEGVMRSKNYISLIEQIYSQHDLPSFLAYLPHVESSFQFEAWSKVGAAGIWQLMPRIAKHYQLVMNKNIDERMDPIKATFVAAKVFKDFSKILKNNWPLVITAYNNGAKEMLKDIKLTLKKSKLDSKDIANIDGLNLIDRLETDHFQFASKNFYFSFLAAAQIASSHSIDPINHLFHSFTEMKSSSHKDLINYDQLHEKYKLEQIQVIELDKSINLAWLLKTFDLNFKEFRESNLHLLDAQFSSLYINRYQQHHRHKLVDQKWLSLVDEKLFFQRAKNIRFPKGLFLYLPIKPILMPSSEQKVHSSSIIATNP